MSDVNTITTELQETGYEVRVAGSADGTIFTVVDNGPRSHQGYTQFTISDADGNFYELVWRKDGSICTYTELETIIDDLKEEMPLGIKYDGDKPRWELLPKGTVNQIVQVLTYGSKKYSDNNWQKVTPFRERYYGAAMRHIDAWWGGETKDPETGFNHLAHAVCCLLFLLWGDDNG